MNTNVRYSLWKLVVLGGLVFSNPSVADRLDDLVETCISCHGKDGVSTEAKVPSIAGLSDDYIGFSLEMFQKGERPCVEAEYHTGSKKGSRTDMCKIVQNLGENDIQLLGEYFAKQKFVRTPQIYDVELAKMGEAIYAKKCEECHTKSGCSPDDNVGILGGQKMDYLREQIRFVKDGKRFTSKKMKKRLESIDDAGLEAVVHYFGSIQ